MVRVRGKIVQATTYQENGYGVEDIVSQEQVLLDRAGGTDAASQATPTPKFEAGKKIMPIN